jgi:plasmid stabilization system protein ParE
MVYRVKLMPRAQRDLSAIYVWVGANSSRGAFDWYRQLKEEILTLRTRACSHYSQCFDDECKAEKRQEDDVQFFKT